MRGVSSCTYYKTCSGNATLYATSCHPFHTIRAIPVDKLIRAYRNCLQYTVFFEEYSNISSRLAQHGYTA